MLAKDNIFSKLDLSQAYLQLQLDDASALYVSMYWQIVYWLISTKSQHFVSVMKVYTIQLRMRSYVVVMYCMNIREVVKEKQSPICEFFITGKNSVSKV